MKPQIPGYQIIAEISRRPTSVVYRAFQLSLKRVVLIKALQPQAATEPDIVQRFEREAQACARLKHPNIVDVFDFGTFDGSFYIAMEYVEGKSLQDLLAGGQRLPLDITLFIVTQVLQGLAHAHARGVIHRDLKPANVLIAQDGTVKITDFGLATFLDSPGSTTHGGVVGTPAYMSPEQISGEALDGRSDLFSLGATFYEMLTHRQAFGGATTATCLNKVLNEEPPRLESLVPSLPEALQAVLLRLLKKDREERYASTEKVLDDLEKFCRSSHIVLSGRMLATYLENPQAYSFTPSEQPKKPKISVKRRWLPIAAALALLLILY